MHGILKECINLAPLTSSPVIQIAAVSRCQVSHAWKGRYQKSMKNKQTVEAKISTVSLKSGQLQSVRPILLMKLVQTTV